MTSINQLAARTAGAVTALLSKTDKVRMIATSELGTNEELLHLYQQENEKVEAIAKNMINNGFDRSQPIIVLHDNTIIDGHSRWMAAKKAGLKKVPVIYKNFENTNDALMYAEHLQLDRRNLSEAEKLKHLEHLLQLKEKAKSSGKSTEEFSDEHIAKQLDISPRQVQKMREVEKKASAEQLEAIRKSEKSVNEVHAEIKAAQGLSRKSPKRVREEEAEPHVEKIAETTTTTQTDKCESAAEEVSKRQSAYNWDLSSFQLGMKIVQQILLPKIDKENFKTEFSLLEKLSAIDSMEEIFSIAKQQGLLEV